MFKKVMSIALAATMVASASAVAVSAAEVEEVAVAAEDSSAVGAENSSEVGADSESEAAGATSKIYFDVESAGWKNYKTVSCHIWRADGKGDWTSWGTRKELCTKEDEGLYSYDTKKTGNTLSTSDGNVYCVIFYVDTGMQTYNTIMSGSCLGDTLYCETKDQVENPVDSNKKCNIGVWKNNPNCGPQKVINSSGVVFGNALAEGTTDVTLMADYLIEYYNDEAKLVHTQKLLDELKISPVDVMSNVKYKMEEAVKNEDKTQDEANERNTAIQNVLKNCTDPTKGGEKVDDKELDNAEAKDDAKDNGGSSSNNGGSSNKNSNSVSSGQETTIFFVFAGVMLAAAGTMFLARRREN